jgi:glycosyltransferase involved in cell wall biosynthesis
MRIAYLCADPGVPVFGHKGCSIHVQELIRAFRGTGADVELFATQLGGNPPSDLRSLIVHELPAIPAGDRTARERAARQANHTIRSLLADQGPFDFIYERYSLWCDAGMLAARDAGIPGILEVNSPLIDEQSAYRGLTDRPAAEQIAERTFAAAEHIIAVSNEVAAYVKRFTGGTERVHVVPNGVNVERFAPRANVNIAHEQLTIGFVGSLKPWHGLQVLVEAFSLLHRRLNDVRLLVIGDGPGRDSLEANLAATGLLTRVHLTGAVAPEDVPDLLAQIDVAVAPYPALPDFYFSPLKVLEYMAAGRAVVASRIGQIAELIDDEVSGILVPPGDVPALADACERLALDPGLRARLGARARETVCRRHSWNSVARRILRLVGGAVAEPAVGAAN